MTGQCRIHVLLVDLPDLQAGDRRVDGRDHVVVDLEPVPRVEVVVHARQVEEDINVVDQRSLRMARGRRGVAVVPLTRLSERVDLDVLELAALLWTG